MELPRPEVIRCFFDKSFEPHLPAMELCWDADSPSAGERVWYLPGNLSLKGPAPDRFGITINRRAQNSYRVRVLWNGLCLIWEDLTRVQIMTCSFALVLNALGTDLWYILNQPVEAHALPGSLAA